ncbi:MAG: hypothetical protein K0V04_31315 [Deltaproteobacteria bacterium]|nr:hypothetical protein [Deltaproteobacteria bacterium]
MSDDEREVATRLFDRLRSLNPDLADAPSVTCVGLRLEDGTRVDVFKAELANAALPVWRVQGLVGEGPGVVERRGLVLGTRDGRAILAAGMPSLDRGLEGEPVVAVESVVRPLRDLSEVIAQAVERRLGQDDEPREPN